MIHVAIIHKRYLDAILASEKTIESRLSKIRVGPFERITEGERIYFKQVSGSFLATAIAKNVTFFDQLTPKRVASLKRKYNDRIGGDDAYWSAKSSATCGSLIWLHKVEPIDAGPSLASVQMPGSRRAWFVLGDEFDVYPECAAKCRVRPNLRSVRSARA